MLSPNHPSSATSSWQSLDTPHPSATGSRGCSGHSRAGKVLHREEASSVTRGHTCTLKGKAQCMRSDMDHHQLSAFHSLALPCMVRMDGSWLSHWAELSGAATAPYISPVPCFPTPHIHHLFRLCTLQGGGSFFCIDTKPSPAGPWPQKLQ